MNTARQLVLFLSMGLVCLACATAPPSPTRTGYEQVQALARTAIREGALVIDVRTPEEFAQGHIDGALNISHDQIQDRTSEIPGDRSRVIVLYCRSGRRSGIAEKVLREQGFTGAVNAGGFENLKAALGRGD